MSKRFLNMFFSWLPYIYMIFNINIYIYIYIYISAIIKTMCPRGYQHDGFVATHTLGCIMFVYIYRKLNIQYLN